MLPIKVPPLGESISEATVSRWLKNEGDAVVAGETLVELETDKITVEVPALKAGVLVRRTRVDGDVVSVDDTLGELDETAVGLASPAVVAPASVSPPSGAAVAAVATAAPPPVRPPYVPPAAPPPVMLPYVPPAAPAAPRDATPSYSAPPAPAAPLRSAPAARRLADETGVDLGAIAGSGRGGVVSKPDVVSAIAAQGASAPAAARPTAAAPTAPAAAAAVAAPSTRPATPSAAPAFTPPTGAGAIGASADSRARETHEKMTTRRKRIAENLLQSQHATAHLTTFNEIDMSAILGLRDRLKEKVEKAYDVKLSYMPFFARATVMALKAYPVVNAQIVGDSIVYKHYVNLGIAVSSDAGLVVPVLKDADSLGIIGVARAIVAVARRAREGKLTMDDLSGGSFTITNGGVFGSLLSTPIINYPQSAIMGLHKMQDRPVAVQGKVEIRPMMYVALSYDHRIIDGQQAVLFLVRVKELMEDPASMLIE